MTGQRGNEGAKPHQRGGDVGDSPGGTQVSEMAGLASRAGRRVALTPSGRLGLFLAYNPYF